MLLIGLTLTRCLKQLDETPGHKDLQVALEADVHQAAVPLEAKGWVDDWLLFAESVPQMQSLVNMWSQTLKSIWMANT